MKNTRYTFCMEFEYQPD